MPQEVLRSPSASESQARLYKDGLNAHRRFVFESEQITKNAFQATEDILEKITHQVNGNQSKDWEIVTLPGPLVITVKGLRANHLLNFNFCQFPIEKVVSADRPEIFSPNESIEIGIAASLIELRAAKRKASVKLHWDREKGKVGLSSSITERKKSSRPTVLQLSSNPLADFNQEETNLGKVLALFEVVQWINQIVTDKVEKRRKTA